MTPPTVSVGLTTDVADAAWAAFERHGLVRRVELPVPVVVLVPSDPVDGMWVTAAATIAEDTRRHVGFSTARRVDAHLVARAIAEAVERTVWWRASHRQYPDTVPAMPLAPGHPIGSVGAQAIRGWSPRDRDPFLADPTTTGSAVHDSPGEAVVRAAREVVERATALRLFHSRALGRQLDVSPWRSLVPGVEIRAWHHAGSGLVSAVVLSPESIPRLGMGAVASPPGGSTSHAVEKCLEEIVQVRAYARRLAGSGTASSASPEDASAAMDPRIRFWSACPPERATQVWLELTTGHDEGDVPLLAGDLTLVDAAETQLADGTVQYYARVAHTRLPYAVHRVERELDVWRGLRTTSSFVPIPLM